MHGEKLSCAFIRFHIQLLLVGFDFISPGACNRGPSMHARLQTACNPHFINAARLWRLWRTSTQGYGACTACSDLSHSHHVGRSITIVRIGFRALSIHSFRSHATVCHQSHALTRHRRAPQFQTASCGTLSGRRASENYLRSISSSSALRCGCTPISSLLGSEDVREKGPRYIEIIWSKAEDAG